MRSCPSGAVQGPRRLSGNTYLEAALLLDEYLEVTSASPLDYVTKYAGTTKSFDVIVFDQVTPAEMRAPTPLPRSARPGSPVKVEKEIVQPGFDKIERKHPIVRFTALDQVNIARGHKLKPEPGDKVIGAFTTARSSSPARVQDTSSWPWASTFARAISRCAWRGPCCSSTRSTGSPTRTPRTCPASAPATCGAFPWERRAASDDDAPRRRQGAGARARGSRGLLGQRSGFYELATAIAPAAQKDPKDVPAPGGDESLTQAGGTVRFAANLLDDAESTIGPAEKLTVDGKDAGTVEASTWACVVRSGSCS